MTCQLSQSAGENSLFFPFLGAVDEGLLDTCLIGSLVAILLAVFLE
jgi:hypothetical protein